MTVSNVHTQVQVLEEEFTNALANVKNASELESLRIQYLGRKGCISKLFKKLEILTIEDRKPSGEILIISSKRYRQHSVRVKQS